MKIKFSIGRAGGSVTVQREKDDRKAKASGFIRKTHGWGAEIHLLYMMRMALNAMGFNLASVKTGSDGHLFGDDHMRYLRTPIKELRKTNVQHPYLYIIDGNYAVRSSADAYNQNEEVRFEITGNPFDDYPQPDWYKKVQAICKQHDIPCEVYLPKERRLATISK